MARRERVKPAVRNDSVSALKKELDRRTRELKEALEQQTAASNVLRVIASSPGELSPVFQSILESATRLCEAKFGNLALIEDGMLRMVALHGAPPAYAEERRRAPAVPLDSAIGRLVATKESVHIADITLDEGIANGPIVKLAGARTLLVVPMLKENDLVGALGVYRQDVRPFTDEQVALLQTFAAQAVIAIENTRLLNELRQRTDDLSKALERQTATSDVLRVISGSHSDLKPVFQVMLENAVRICRAKFGVLYYFRDGLFEPAAVVNAPPDYADFVWSRGRFLPTPGNVLDRVMRTKQLVHSLDETTEPVPARSAEIAGARSLLAVPLLKDGELIGGMGIFRQEVHAFTDKQIELVQSFASQAVIAIENVRLLNELRARTDDLSESLEQQTATSEILGVISNSLSDTQPVFDAIVRSGLKLFPGALVSVALRYGETINAAAVAAPDPARVEAWRRTISRTPLARDYMHGAALLDRRIVDFPDVADAPAEFVAGGQNFLSSGNRAITIMPMMRGDDAIGLLSVVRLVPGPLSDKQIEVLKTFASQAVIAIENTRLLNELRTRTGELEQSYGLVQQQASQLEEQSQQLRKMNEQLGQRVSEQVAEIERMGRLRRFLPPQVADLIVSSGAEKQLESHRREITALFCDLRGFTGFSESSDPEDVMALLHEYHTAIGGIIYKYGGTLERFAGDGVMVIFNDPVPLPNPALQAAHMALEMRAAIGALVDKWRRLGHEIGFGIGISHGYATLGTIGFEGRFDYAAIGTVSNVAARLCDEAKPGQILISPRVLMEIEHDVTVESAGEFALKGIRRPMPVHNILDRVAPQAVPDPAGPAVGTGR